MAEPITPAAPAPAAPATPAPATPAPATPAAGEPTAVLSGDSLLGGGTPPATPAAPAAPAAPAVPAYNKEESDKTIRATMLAEGKTETEIQEAIKKADDAAAAAVKPGAPEKYEPFKVDPGLNLDPKMIDEFGTVAKTLNLNQQQAQGLVDLQTRYAKAQGEAILAQFRQTVDTWKAESIKVLGAGYKEELGIAAKAIERFGNPGLRQILNDTGLGNHPDVVLFFNKIGKAISEDTLADGKGKGGTKTDGELFYPSMPK